MNILVLGDVHGSWAALACTLAWHRPDMCFVAGDFGFWPIFDTKGEMYTMLAPVLRHTAVHFVDGNHECHPALLAYAPRGSYDAVELTENLIYHPRGSIMTLPDGRVMFFAGGAKSVDAPMRTEGYDWFPEEILERKHLPQKLPKADIVLAHTVPTAFSLIKFDPFNTPNGWDTSPDPSCRVLDAVLRACEPTLWLAGHFHRRMDGMYGSVAYHVLDMLHGATCVPHTPHAYWLCGQSTRPDEAGVALPTPQGEPIILKAVYSANGLYMCLDMTNLPPAHAEVYARRERQYNKLRVTDALGNTVTGLPPREVDKFANTLALRGWDAQALLAK